MEDSQTTTNDNNTNPNPDTIPNRNPNNNPSELSYSTPVWPTIDGQLGISDDESLSYARRFYKFGFALLPWLWAVNCLYFWPVLRHPRAFPALRPCRVCPADNVVSDVVRSAIGFVVFTAVLGSWALTFAIGGERLFGSSWDKLVMYNVADKLGLTGWI